MEVPTGFLPKVRLSTLTTLGMGGPADYVATAHSVAEVQAACAWANEHHMPVVVLGEGSNMVVHDGPVHKLVLKMALPGFEVEHEDTRSATIRVGAGEHWDNVVRRSVELGLSGIEAMSMIPGTAGAAPVQNAGAYGQETADTLVELEAFDTQTGQVVSLARADCNFHYRSSRFRAEDDGRFVILAVVFKLRKAKPKPPTYESLKRYLADHHISDPTVAQIREAVMAIRARILPDPTVVPNAGSFFKNPIVSAETLDALQHEHPSIPAYPYGEQFKVSAGWLLDQCGFKNMEKFGLKIWEHHALVITNPHGAGFAELEQLIEYMTTAVHKKFGLVLTPEPLFID